MTTSTIIYSDEFVSMLGVGILLFVVYHAVRYVTAEETDDQKRRHAFRGLVVSALTFAFYLYWVLTYAPYTDSWATQSAFFVSDSLDQIATTLAIGPDQPRAQQGIVEQVVAVVQLIGLVTWVVFFAVTSVFVKTPIQIKRKIFG